MHLTIISYSHAYSEQTHTYVNCCAQKSQQSGELKHFNSLPFCISILSVLTLLFSIKQRRARARPNPLRQTKKKFFFIFLSLSLLPFWTSWQFQLRNSSSTVKRKSRARCRYLKCIYWILDTSDNHNTQKFETEDQKKKKMIFDCFECYNMHSPSIMCALAESFCVVSRLVLLQNEPKKKMIQTQTRERNKRIKYAVWMNEWWEINNEKKDKRAHKVCCNGDKLRTQIRFGFVAFVRSMSGLCTSRKLYL